MSNTLEAAQAKITSINGKPINFYYGVFSKQFLNRKQVEAASPGATAIFDFEHKCWVFTDEGIAQRVAAAAKNGEVRRYPSTVAHTLQHGTAQEKAQLQIEMRYFEKCQELEALEILLDDDLKYLGIDRTLLDESAPDHFSEQQKAYFIKLKEHYETLKKMRSNLEVLRKQVKPEEKQGKGKFEFDSLASLLQKPKKIDWLIKGYLEAGTLAALFGEPEAMKSFVSLSMGLSIATGLKWHGSPIGQPGSVFYIAGEGHNGISRRLKAWTQHHNITPENVPFFVSNKAMQVLDNSSVLEVVTCIEKLKAEHGDPVLIIIDTLNRNFGNGDENSNKDMTTFVSNIDNHIRTRFNCAVLIVHHTPLSDTKRMRGGTALHGATDWEYSLTKSNDGKRIFESAKTKDHGESSILSFIPQVIELDGWDDEDGMPMTSCVLTKCTNGIRTSKENKSLKGANKIALNCFLSLMEEKNTDKVFIEELRTACYDSGISDSALKESKQRNFRRAFNYLQDNNYIECAGGDYWRLAGTGQGINETKFVQDELFKD